MKALLLVLILSASVLLSQCDPTILEQFAAANPQSSEPVEEATLDALLIEEGIRVYRSQYCGSCHTLDAANTRGTFGPEHNQAGTLAAERILLDTYRGSATTAEDYLRESILEPQIYYTTGFEATSHHMPAYTHLPPADIEAMVYLLLNQR